MAYEITASRKRPKTFDELVGQEFIIATLKNSIKHEHIAHAYLFAGPRGVGKTSAARILAKSINCESGPTENPCGICNACKEITRGQSLDVIEIDGASNTSVNDVREIRDEVLFAPNSYRYKVYIIDEVHMLSNSAFNALLKTIEEPPPYIVFIFATTEIHKVPATIRSRCQQFNFRLISIEDIMSKLQEVVSEIKIKTEKEAILWMAKESTGSLRDAYTLLDQIISFSEGHITLKKIKDKLGLVDVDELNSLLKLIDKGDYKAVLELANKILDSGIAVEQFIIDLASYLRTLLFIKHGITRENILGFSVDSFPLKQIENLTSLQIEKAIELALELYRKIRYSLNQKFELEVLMSKLVRIKTHISPDEIFYRINDIKMRIFNDLVEEEDPVKKGPENRHADEKKEVKILSGDLKNDDLKEKILKLINTKKLALASALNKSISWEIKDNVLFINFNHKDRYSGELIFKEKEDLKEIVSKAIGTRIDIRINYLKELKQNNENSHYNSRIELVKRIFKGEIVEEKKI